MEAPARVSQVAGEASGEGGCACTQASRGENTLEPSGKQLHWGAAWAPRWPKEGTGPGEVGVVLRI